MNILFFSISNFLWYQSNFFTHVRRHNGLLIGPFYIILACFTQRPVKNLDPVHVKASNHRVVNITIILS